MCSYYSIFCKTYPYIKFFRILCTSWLILLGIVYWLLNITVFRRCGFLFKTSIISQNNIAQKIIFFNSCTHLAVFFLNSYNTTLRKVRSNLSSNSMEIFCICSMVSSWPFSKILWCPLFGKFLSSVLFKYTKNLIHTLFRNWIFGVE